MTDCDMWPTSSENRQQILVSRPFIIQINGTRYHRSRRRRDISQRVNAPRDSSSTVMHRSPVTLSAFLINVKQVSARAEIW